MLIIEPTHSIPNLDSALGGHRSNDRFQIFGAHEGSGRSEPIAGSCSVVNSPVNSSDSWVSWSSMVHGDGQFMVLHGSWSVMVHGHWESLVDRRHFQARPRAEVFRAAPGRCLCFDAQAAGYVIGECSISVVVKPYAEKASAKRAVGVAQGGLLSGGWGQFFHHFFEEFSTVSTSFEMFVVEVVVKVLVVFHHISLVCC